MVLHREWLAGRQESLQSRCNYPQQVSKAAFTLHWVTFDQIQKCYFSLAFTLYRWGQCRNLHVGVPGYRPPKVISTHFRRLVTDSATTFPQSSAGTKLYLMAGTKLYRITLSSINAWLIRKTFLSDQKVIWYSVDAAEVRCMVSTDSNASVNGGVL